MFLQVSRANVRARSTRMPLDEDTAYLALVERSLAKEWLGEEDCAAFDNWELAERN